MDLFVSLLLSQSKRWERNLHVVFECLGSFFLVHQNLGKRPKPRMLDVFEPVEEED